MELTPAPDTVWYGSTLVCNKGDLLTPDQVEAWFPGQGREVQLVPVRKAEGPRARRSSR